jgi:transposase
MRRRGRRLELRLTAHPDSARVGFDVRGAVVRVRPGLAPGRAPVDPAILVGLWLYATLDGVGSARELARLCDSEDAYRWLCGGVGVNHHTLSDLRVEQAAWLDKQLTRSVAALLAQGAVTMKRVAQDGLRIRAHAKAASFRRRERLQQLLQDARDQVQALKKQVDE